MSTNDRPVDLHSSRADVRTDAPARYAKQLVSHLGRRAPFVQADNSWTAHYEGAVARIAVADASLVLEVEAPDVETMGRLEHALGSHLERFGQRADLTVLWERSASV